MQEKLNKLLISKRKKYITLTLDNYKDETSFLNELATQINNGADTIEIKVTNKTTKEILSLTRKARELTAIFNALLIIHDRIDIAKLVNADGINLDINSMSIKDAILLTEKTMLIGYTLTTENEFCTPQINETDFIVTPKIIDNIAIHQFINK